MARRDGIVTIGITDAPTNGEESRGVLTAACGGGRLDYSCKSGCSVNMTRWRSALRPACKRLATSRSLRFISSAISDGG